jgi:hypothetical protein
MAWKFMKFRRNHTTILCEPNGQEVGRKLGECLRAAQQNEDYADAKGHLHAN